MYGVLTANTPGGVAFSRPVQRRNLQALRFKPWDSCVFPIHPSQRGARRQADGFEPERHPSQVTNLFQGRL